MSFAASPPPDFLILGAAKAGTTSLASYLGQHPEIFMSPVKEPSFFAFESREVEFHGPGDEGFNHQIVRRRDAYDALFSGAAPDQKTGEASVVYLYDRDAPERIRRHVPDVRLFAVLRHPVERAYSSYLYQVSRGREPAKSFAEALNDEPHRIRAGWQHIWHYAEMGRYGRQLDRYLQHFDRSQLQIHLYESLRQSPRAVVRDMFAFLGANPGFEPDLGRRHGPSGRPRSSRLHAFLTRPRRLKSLLHAIVPRRLARRAGDFLRRKNLRRPPMDPGTRARLLETFEPDVRYVEQLLDVDLSAWRT